MMRRASCRRFVRETSGASALEFALVAPLFFAILFSVAEAGWMMTRAILLDRALDLAVRELRVDSSDGLTADAVRRLICDEAMVIPNCARSIAVELSRIQSDTDFPSASPTCVDRNAGAAAAPQFYGSARATIMLIRVCATATPLTPLLGMGLNMQKDGNDDYNLVSISAFMTEPGT